MHFTKKFYQIVLENMLLLFTLFQHVLDLATASVQIDTLYYLHLHSEISSFHT